MSQQNLSNPLLRNTYQKTEPFLWIHLATLAAVPLTLVLCMMGLAVGNPVFPGWLEMLVLGLPPVALAVWLQWQKPLSPFSLWVVAKPERELSENQLRVFTFLKLHPNGWHVSGWIAAVTGLFAYVVFRQMYVAAPLAAGMAPFPGVLRLFGVLWAEVFFLASNLLLQAGVSAARLMLVPQAEFDRLTPYAPDRVKPDFTVLGMRSPNLLEFEPVQPEESVIEGTTVSLASGTATTSNISPTDNWKSSLAGVFGQESPLGALWTKLSTLLAGKTATGASAPGSQQEPLPQVSSEFSEGEEDEFLSDVDEPEVSEPVTAISEDAISDDSQAQLEYPEIDSELESAEQPEATIESQSVVGGALGIEVEAVSIPEVISVVEVGSEWEEQIPGQPVENAESETVSVDSSIVEGVPESTEQLEITGESLSGAEENPVIEPAVEAESPVATTDAVVAESLDDSSKEQPAAVTDASDPAIPASDRPPVDNSPVDDNDEWV